MDRYQLFAIEHYLSDWPESWTYTQVLEELMSGDEGQMLTVCEHYENEWPEILVVLIADMESRVRGYFGE
jgi:hypothetical protein